MARYVLIFSALLVIPFFVSAQTIPAPNSALEIITAPNNPAPNQIVTIRAVNVGPAVSGSNFVWRINGQVVNQGFGVDTITTRVGAAGSTASVSVVVTTSDGVSLEKTLVVRPASVDLVWEGKTYTHPLYMGRPLPTGSSETVVQAIPNVLQGGVRVSARNLYYQWYINDAQAPEAFGIGLQSLTLESPQFENPFKVRVVVETTDGVISTETQATIEPVRPEIIFYEYTPLIGYRIERALTDVVNLFGSEITFTAFPHFVANLDRPDYSWNVNGAVTRDTGRNDREITFRRTDEGQGDIFVNFSFETANELFEREERGFRLNY